jgi:hypothetical protein
MFVVVPNMHTCTVDKRLSPTKVMEMTWFLAVRIDRSARRAEWFFFGGGAYWKTREIERK